MPDTIGVTPSILAILDLGRAIYNGLNNMHIAPVTLDNVKLEVFHLQNYLHRLKDLIHMPSSPLSYLPEDSQQGLKETLECLKKDEEQLLEALKTFLKQKSRMGAFVRQVKWVWGKEKDVEKLRGNLEIHKTTLTATVSVLQFLAIGKVTKMQEKPQQGSTVFAVDYGAPLPEKPHSANVFDFDDVPDLDGVKEILHQDSSRDLDFDNDQDKEDFRKIQRYKASLAEFVHSEKFEEALARVSAQGNMQVVPVIDYRSPPTPEEPGYQSPPTLEGLGYQPPPIPEGLGYHNPSMTQTWGTHEPRIAAAEYHQGNNYVASGYHINQQPDSPPVTPPGGHYWEPPPQPVNRAGSVPSPPDQFSYSTQTPTAHAFQPQSSGPGWQPDAHSGARAPPHLWEPNFHMQQRSYTYPSDSMHTYDQPSYGYNCDQTGYGYNYDQPGYGYEWNGTSGNGYA